MAYPQTRSMNGDLSEGLTDGKYKKVINNRANAEPTTQAGRTDLFDRHFGIHEAPVKSHPDGLRHPTPGYVPTAEPDLL